MCPLLMFKQTQALIDVFKQESLQSPTSISDLWTNIMVMSFFGSVALLGTS